MKFFVFFGQFTRYSVVGLTSNLVLYLAYLGLTGFGWGHKIAMSVLYAVGILQTFVFNKKWTFSHNGNLSLSFARYVYIYSVGYLLNLGALFVLVDCLGYSHELVQAVMVLAVAVLIFVMQKVWVFRSQVI
jgi:putative flippase GtrA